VSGKKRYLVQFSDTKVRQALKNAGGHVKKAAAALGVGFSSFYARLKTMREDGSPIKTAAALAKKTPAKKAAASAAVRKAVVKKRKTAIKKARVEKWAVKKAPAKKKTSAKKVAAPAKKRPGKKKR
jgi:hypothetical protein